MASSGTLWQKLASLPNSNISYNRVICGIDQSLNLVYSFQREDSILSKYSVNKDKWIKQENIPKLAADFYLSTNDIVTIDGTEKSLYLYNCKGIMAKATLKNASKNKWEFFTNPGISDDFDQRYGPQGLIINNELHIIGGLDHAAHFKFNAETRNFDKLHDFEHQLYYHRCIKVKDKILSFGGRYHGQEISEYYINQNKWRKLRKKLPIAINRFGCVAVLNGKFVLLFGGDGSDGYFFVDDVLIYSVKDESITKSKVKCPRTGEHFAFKVNQTRSDEFLVHGFVRDTWRLSAIDEHLYPPQYLIKMIDKYYFNEWVHLISKYHGEHSKMSVFDIL